MARTRIHPAVFFVLLAVGCASGCIGGGMRRPHQDDAELVFSQAQKALDVRDYQDAAELLQVFLEQFPDSEGYSWALQRMGESMEGLLQIHYQRPLDEGIAEAAARRSFLDAYGKYNCWLQQGARLAYDNSHYRQVLEKYPDSPIADEAAYRLVPRQGADYQGRPEGLLAELQALEGVLERFPSTSFRYEILYNIAHHCHVLYEMYTFSNLPGVADREKAAQYKEKARYSYKLALKSPQHSRSAEKAWEGLQQLEDGQRIFR